MSLALKGRTSLLAGVAFACSAMRPASAHVILPTYSAFDNGALHAALNPQMLAPLLALGFALRAAPKASVAGALGLWIAAFVCGALFWNQPGNPLAGFGVPLAFLSGGAALMLSGWRTSAVALLAALCVGLYAGGINRQEDLSQGLPSWFTLGAGLGGALVVFFACEAARVFGRPWMSIAFRIAASWLLAIGVMFLGLGLRPQTDAPIALTNTPGDMSPCAGPHRHGVDGEIICLPVSTIDKAGTPSAIEKYGDAPPVLDGPALTPRNGEATP